MIEFSDNEFLSYCLIHSETPLHLFSSDMVKRLHALADVKILVVDGSLTSMDYDYVRKMVDKARDRMAA